MHRKTRLPRWTTVALVVVAACVAPRIRPLTGIPYEGRVPTTALAPGHARLLFRWEYDDPFFSARGEGAARIAPPDSVRLDFFVDGGLGSGGAILIGDSLRTAAEDGRRYLPPVQLLWGALGVLRVTGADTVALLDGEVIRVEIGPDPTYRAAFGDAALAALERIEGGRLREQVVRDSVRIEYRNRSSRRRLTLSSLRRVPDAPYDPSIWRP